MIFASGLKYVGVPVTALGWVLGTILAAAAAWLAWARPWRRGREPAAATAGADPQALADPVARGTRPG